MLVKIPFILVKSTFQSSNKRLFHIKTHPDFFFINKRESLHCKACQFKGILHLTDLRLMKTALTCVFSPEEMDLYHRKFCIYTNFENVF